MAATRFQTPVSHAVYAPPCLTDFQTVFGLRIPLLVLHSALVDARRTGAVSSGGRQTCLIRKEHLLCSLLSLVSTVRPNGPVCGWETGRNISPAVSVCAETLESSSQRSHKSKQADPRVDLFEWNCELRRFMRPGAGPAARDAESCRRSSWAVRYGIPRISAACNR